MFPAVYADSASTPSWRRSVLAATFYGGLEAAASGVCAAALHSFPGFPATQIEITTPRQLRKAPFRTRRGAIPEGQIVRVGPLRVTDASRTLLDVAASTPQEALEEAVDTALRRSLTTLSRLRWILRTCGTSKRGASSLKRIVEMRSHERAIPESVLETRLWRPLCKLGVPPPVPQFAVSNGRYRIDFAFPHAMVAVEAQGYAYHSSRKAWEKDIDKLNALTAMGWSVVYLTWNDVNDDLSTTVARLQELLLPRLL